MFVRCSWTVHEHRMNKGAPGMNRGAGCTNLHAREISFLGCVKPCTLRPCSFGGGGCSRVLLFAPRVTDGGVDED